MHEVSTGSRYATVLALARRILAAEGCVEVAYDALGANTHYDGLAPRLSADLGASWRRDDDEWVMVFEPLAPGA